MHESRERLTQAKRCVIKIGSALLTNNGQGLDLPAISAWVAHQIEVRAPSSFVTMRRSLKKRVRSGAGMGRQISLCTTPGWTAYVVTPVPARRRASCWPRSPTGCRTARASRSASIDW